MKAGARKGAEELNPSYSVTGMGKDSRLWEDSLTVPAPEDSGILFPWISLGEMKIAL